MLHAYRFICTGGSPTPTPTDGIVGYQCTPGGYCLAGATEKTPCPAGSYNPTIIAQGPADCIPCPPGFYCEGSVNAEPTGLCSAGYVCDVAASHPKQSRAPKGHYSTEGSKTATPCAKGTYNPDEGQGECQECPAG